MTQTRLNYSSHAISDLYDLAGGFPGFMGQWKDSFDRETIDGVAATARDCGILIEVAEKFIMPDWGRVFTDDEWHVVMHNVEIQRRLPYPVVALEYHCDYVKYPLHRPNEEAMCSKRIALAVEYEVLGELELDDGLKQCVLNNPNDCQEGFFIFPIAYSDDGKFWAPPPCGLFVPREGRRSLAAGKEGKVVVDFITSHIVTLPLGLRSYKDYKPDYRIERMARDLADEILAVLHMQAALSLDKGRHTTLPAPEKLNKKRAKKKKPPLFEYKLLDIVADVMTPIPEGDRDGSQREGRHHASPRMHSRRGHVRRLASGKTTWVRNTVVGKPSRGQIIKDYSIHE